MSLWNHSHPCFLIVDSVFLTHSNRSWVSVGSPIQQDIGGDKLEWVRLSWFVDRLIAMYMHAVANYVAIIAYYISYMSKLRSVNAKCSDPCVISRACDQFVILGHESMQQLHTELAKKVCNSSYKIIQPASDNDVAITGKFTIIWYAWL